jgi:regulatory protein
MPAEDLERCYVSALRILKYRFNSAVELKRKLRAKAFTDEIIDSTLERLRAEKWLDDARFASAFVRTRQNKRVGARRIARELGAAGVDRDVVKEAIDQNADPERERADLVALCEKRYGLMERRKGADYVASAEGRNKLTIYLLNQGYDSALVREIVKETLVNHR